VGVGMGVRRAPPHRAGSGSARFSRLAPRSLFRVRVLLHGTCMRIDAHFGAGRLWWYLGTTWATCIVCADCVVDIFREG
jgi:hypothetical protein